MRRRRAAVSVWPGGGGGGRFVIVPSGRYVNVAVERLRRGDEVGFWSGGGVEYGRVSRKCKVEVRSGFFRFMLGVVYGDGVSVEDWVERWEAWALTEGLGKFRAEEAYIIYYVKIYGRD